MRNLQHHRGHRSAFTLIELLIVIAVIAVLAALSSAAYFYAIGRQYEKNTNATIENIYGVLKKQWKYVIDEAKKESIPDNIRKLAAPDSSGDRAKVMWVMLRLTEAFPQSYAEIKTYGNAATSPIALAGGAQKYSRTYYAKWNAATGGATGGDPQIESSACLYLALTTAKGGHVLNVDQLPVKPLDWDPKSAIENPDGLMDFCDAWQRPMAFFRFPYLNASLAAKAPVLTGPKGNYNNPFDPLKMLPNASWPAASRTLFENAIRMEVSADLFTTPVLVSGGRDNLLGLQFSNASRGFPDMSFLTALPGAGDLDNNRILDHKDDLYSFDIVAP